MSTFSSNSDTEAIETARILLDIQAVNLRPEKPYSLTAGWASPVYIDCRWVISFPEARKRIIKLAVNKLEQDIGFNKIDVVAGGETAGIPYSAWIAEAQSKPMVYVRKKPKGFGRNAQIEGTFTKGQQILLVEDLATDGGSKITFVDALRQAGGDVKDIFVIFYYGVFPGAEKSMKDMRVNLHYLANWNDVLVVAEKDKLFDNKTIEEVRRFLLDPIAWSKAHGGRSS